MSDVPADGEHSCVGGRSGTALLRTFRDLKLPELGVQHPAGESPECA